MLQVEIGGAAIGLLAERAAYLPNERTLLVADVHIGKAASFRGLGVPVPAGTTEGTLARLSAALERSGAKSLIVLGDLIHSARSYAPATRATVTDRTPCSDATATSWSAHSPRTAPSPTSENGTAPSAKIEAKNGRCASLRASATAALLRANAWSG